MGITREDGAFSLFNCSVIASARHEARGDLLLACSAYLEKVCD
jgi:hypothetical protein